MSQEMKKGDKIQKRKEIKKGDAMWHNLKSLEDAKAHIPKLNEHYNLPSGALFEAGYDPLNSGMFAILALEDTYVTMDAVVQWVVDMDMSIKYPNGSFSILDMTEEENQGWVVVESATPQYQSDVEHMSDEDLRASIDALRGQRLTRPVVKKKTGPKAPPMSEQDKKLTKTLGNMSAEDKQALMKKLGMVD